MNSSNLSPITYNISELQKKEQSEGDHGNYFIDPCKGDISDQVNYDANMYMISPGVPDCPSKQCVRKEPFDQFRLNPNIKSPFVPSEETYMLNPKSNKITTKWEIDQKQQLQIFPHMYAGQTDLLKMAEKKWKGGIEVGGTDYPIPMRFQLRYLQQAPPDCPSTSGVDYDIHLKDQQSIVPDSRQFDGDNSQNDYQTIPAGSQRCYLQRGITGKPTQKKVLGRGGWSAGVYDAPSEWLSERNIERENRQRDAVRQQPLYSNYYKGIPREGETLSTRISLPERTEVKAAAFPSAEAQKSSFFGMGPPLPPPNPALLSSINSELLSQPEATKHGALDSSVLGDYFEKDASGKVRYNNQDQPIMIPGGQKMYDQTIALQNETSQAAISRETDLPTALVARHQSALKTERNTSNTSGGLLTDQNWSIAPAPEITTKSLIMESFKDSTKTLKSTCPSGSGYRTEQQFLRKPELVEATQAIYDKQITLRRIEAQLTHIDRIIPMLRRKQVQAKDESHIMNVHESTNKLKQLEQIKSQLELSQNLLKESIVKIQQTHKLLPNQLKAEPREISLAQHYKQQIPDKQGIFYKEDAFNGTEIVLPLGEYDYPLVGKIGNNMLKSFKIPQNTILYLYTKPKKQGIRLKYVGPAMVSKLPDRYRHDISGIEFVESVIPYEVIAYTGTLFQGNVVSLAPGFYDYPTVGGLGKGRLSSMRIPAKLMVTLYSRPKKSGNKITFIGPLEVKELPIGVMGEVSGIEIQVK